MPLSHVLEIETPASTGNQTYTLPFEFKALIRIGSGWNAALLGTFDPDIRISFGVATADLTQYCISAGIQDGAGTSNTSERMAATFISDVRWSEVVYAEATVTALSSTGFTLNWTTVPSTPVRYYILAIGGSDITASILTWDLQTTTGLQSVTGAPKQPTAVLHLSTHQTGAIPASSADANFCVGAMTDDALAGTDHEQAFIANFDEDNQGTTNCNRWANGLTSCLGAVTGGSGVRWEFKYSSMDTSGFTVNVLTAPGTTRKVVSLCLSGADFEVNGFTVADATGPATVTTRIAAKSGLLFHAASGTGAGVHARGGMGVVADISPSGNASYGTCWQSEDAAGTSGADTYVGLGALTICDNATPSITTLARFTGVSGTSLLFDYSSAGPGTRSVFYFLVPRDVSGLVDNANVVGLARLVN